ncbi:hypothetical protein JOD27_002159 [Lentzea nigeriaca]|nr:hypothetical protein [Lentzea nigeriaca]
MPPPSRPTSQWWTEPFETATSLSTVTETVVVEGAAREARAARPATLTRVAVSTVTETVRAGGAKRAVDARNEVPADPGGGGSTSDTSAPPVVTTSTSVAEPPAPPVATATGSSSPASSSGQAPPSSTPRSEDPLPPVVTPPVQPPCEKGESGPHGRSEGSQRAGDRVVVVSLELPASPAEVLSTSSAPSAGA